MIRSTPARALILLLPLALLSACRTAPGALDLTLEVPEPNLDNIHDSFDAVVTFHNAGRDPVLLPRRLIAFGHNLDLAVYRRADGHPAFYDEHTGSYGRVFVLRGADPGLRRLEPGESFRIELPSMAVGRFLDVPAGDPEIGLWQVRAFFNAHYTRQNLRAVPEGALDELWRGIAVSNPVTITIMRRAPRLRDIAPDGNGD